MRISPMSTILPIVGVCGFACESRPRSAGESYIARDSADVRIIESLAPAWTQGVQIHGRGRSPGNRRSRYGGRIPSRERYTEVQVSTGRGPSSVHPFGAARTSGVIPQGP